MPYLLKANTHYTGRNVGSLVNTHLLMWYSPSSGLLESPKEVCDGKGNSANGLDIRKSGSKDSFIIKMPGNGNCGFLWQVPRFISQGFAFWERLAS